MPADPFVSYAQNGEDVVLRRVFRDIEDGRYIDVGAHDPVIDSVTHQLYERGWSGVNLEPVEQPFRALTARRTRDTNLQVAAGAEPGEATIHVVPDTGLSTLLEGTAKEYAGEGLSVEPRTVAVVTLDQVWDQHLKAQQVHLLKVDVEGAEEQVLAGLDLTRHRPWVLLLEATEPRSTEPAHQAWEPTVLAAGYDFCLFDGLSRWYLAQEHRELAAALSYPACVFDDYVLLRTVKELEELRARHADLLADATWQADHQRARAEHAEWQLSLVEQERDWLRGLHEQERARADAATLAAERALSTRIARRVRRSLPG